MYIIETICKHIYNDNNKHIRVYDDFQKRVALREYKKQVNRCKKVTSNIMLYHDQELIDGTINFITI